MPRAPVWRRLSVATVVVSVLAVLLFASNLGGSGSQRPGASVDQRGPSVASPASTPSYPPAMGDSDERPAARPERVVKKLPAGKGTSAWQFAPVQTHGMTVGPLYTLASSRAVGPETAEAIVNLAYKLKDCSTFLNQRRATAAVEKAGKAFPESCAQRWRWKDRSRNRPAATRQKR